MALISCPECKFQISDQATSCPKCGYPLQQDQKGTLFRMLVGHQWHVRSATLAGAFLEPLFKSDGKLEGMIKKEISSSLITPSQLSGTWQAMGLQLVLEFVLTTKGFQMPTIINIQFTQMIEDPPKLLGIDQFTREWQWERIG